MHCIRDAVIGTRRLELSGLTCNRLIPRSRIFMWGVRNVGEEQVGSANTRK